MAKSPTLNDDLLHIGLELFYRICTSIETFQLLFPTGKEVYEICLNKLGSVNVQNNNKYIAFFYFSHLLQTIQWNN